MADARIENLTTALRDALYVGVGAGVIAFQKAQVQRRELMSQVTSQFGDARNQIDSVAGRVEDRVKVLEDRLESAEARIEALLDQVEGALPGQARDALKQARRVAQDTRTQVRTLRARAA